MPLYVKLIASVLASIFFIIFVLLMKKRSIKPFHSFLWFCISLLMFSVIIFERFYKWLANSLGLTDASFFVILGVIFFLLIYVLYLSIKISEMSDRIHELISFNAILENKLRNICKNDD